jgi:hypothetical protein
MIADQHVYFAAGRFGLNFELHEQVHGPPGVRPAIEDVADDDKMRRPGYPGQLFVDDGGLLHCLDHRVVRAVDIGDRHDSGYAVILPPGGSRRRGSQHQPGQE